MVTGSLTGAVPERSFSPAGLPCWDPRGQIAQASPGGTALPLRHSRPTFWIDRFSESVGGLEMVLRKGDSEVLSCGGASCIPKKGFS